MLPNIDELIDVLKILRDQCGECTCDAEDSYHAGDCFGLLPVRLQVTEDDWTVNHGDPGFDTDHDGHWGATSIAATDEDDILDLAAQQLIEEVEESMAEEEAWAY